MVPNASRIALTLASTLLSTHSALADWDFTAVPNQSVHEGDGARMFTGPDGSLHFLFTTFYYASTGNINYHALVGGSWIDEPLWGEYGGMGISPVFVHEGHLHFLHNRGWISAGYQLRLASRDAGDWTGWTHTQVAPAGEFPAPCSLAIDPQGNFHAAFVETDNGDLIYAAFDGTSWTFEQTGEGPDASKAVHIGVSASGNPQITYITGSGDIDWLTRVSGQWSTHTVYVASHPTDVAAISSLTDNLGRTHIAYMLRGSALSLRYAHQTASGWIDEVVPVTPTWGGISLALDHAGQPGIAYSVGTPPQSTNVSYVKRNGAIWADQTVTSDGASRLVGLVFKPDGAPVIAIQRGSFNTVMFAGPEACDSIDFNNDTSVFDPIDIDAFLSVYGEGPCIPSNATCNDIDFNNDGSLFDPCDIDSLLLVFSEGPCSDCGL